MSKNKYENKHKKKSLLGSITSEQETKGDIKGSAIETVKDLLIGVVGGGVVGAAVGKASLIVGAGVTAAGHFYKNRLASSFGIGMMASNGFQNQQPVNGIDKEGLEGAKERILTFKDTFSQKFFLDKLIKKKVSTEPGTSGIGEVQYFTYPKKEMLLEGKNDLDFSALDRLENQIANNGMEYGKTQVTGLDDDLEGLDPSNNY